MHMLAGELGIGPRFSASKADVLPLDDSPSEEDFIKADTQTKTIKTVWKMLIPITISIFLGRVTLAPHFFLQVLVDKPVLK